jgi:hypothetical protein
MMLESHVFSKRLEETLKNHREICFQGLENLTKANGARRLSRK